jgi:hypothetical protein
MSWGQDPNPYGNPLRDLWDAGTQAISSKLNAIGSAATAAKDKVVSLAQSAAEATVSAGKKVAAGAFVGAEGAVAATAAVTGYAGYQAVVKPVAGAVGAVQKAAAAVKDRFSPQRPALVPCVPCQECMDAKQRATRIEKRNQLIAQAQASPDPAVQAAGTELKSDMHAVELASLSQDTYKQYDPNATDKTPPSPWHAMTSDELRDAGIRPEEMKAARAVVYTCPDDFPFDPKTVVAFQGTTADPDDILADHDQALGLKTSQYEAAKRLGSSMAGNPAFEGAEVTGHSLGGGKAQAAGVLAGLKGQMFNSAGLNPKTMGLPADGLDQFASDFNQYRSDGGLSQGYGDPLTGTQNSLGFQKVVLGVVKGASGVIKANQWAGDQLGVSDAVAARVPQIGKDLVQRLTGITAQEAQNNFDFSGGKWYIPPALGDVRGVPSKNADGSPSSLAAQHSIVNLHQGIESRKAADIQTMLDGTGNPAPVTDYISLSKGSQGAGQ